MSSYLPNNFWINHTSGNWRRFGSLRRTGAAPVRRLRSPGELAAIHRDNAGYVSRELAFRMWLDNTVFGEAVTRRIAEIGGRV